MEIPPPSRRALLLRALVWCLAALPALAAALWASYAARWPELPGDRLALREGAASWRWDELLRDDGGARHLLAKALHRAALEVPGASIASVTWVTVLLAVSTALALGSLLRRSHALTGLAGPASLAAAGLLVASPAFGLVWLHGERLGLLLAPLLLLLALGWLQGTSRPALRQVGALALVAIAPFCHTHGLLVGVALLPAIVAAAHTAGSRRIGGWVGAALVLSLAAGWYSVQPLAAQGLSAGGGIFAVLPFAAFVRDLCMHAGSAWLDLLPSTELDELTLGALSWLAPLVLLFVGDRSVAARARTAPWWSCVLFGLGLVLWNVLRYDAEPPVGRWREALFGVFLLPVGLLGVVAGRFGGSALRIAFGALLVLAAQDWWLGLEDVRIARSLTQQQEARQQLPAAWTKTLPQVRAGLAAADESELRERGRVPEQTPRLDEALATAFTTAWTEGAPSPAPVAIGRTLRGELRGSLRTPPPVLVLLVVLVGSDAPRVVAATAPDFRAHGRAVPWEILLPEAELERLSGPAGGDVVALGVLTAPLQFVPLSGGFVVRDGVLASANTKR